MKGSSRGILVLVLVLTAAAWLHAVTHSADLAVRGYEGSTAWLAQGQTDKPNSDSKSRECSRPSEKNKKDCPYNHPSA